MAKLRQIEKGTRAVKTVRFRLANAPIPADWESGQGLPDDEHTIKVGVRVLTGSEIATIYENARRSAKAAGVETWLDTDPLCRLHEMAETLAIACVDWEAPDEPFFVSAAEVLESDALGGANIAYLWEQHHVWQDEVGLNVQGLNAAQVVGLLMMEAGRPEESGESPLARMRPATRESFLHITAKLYVSLLTAKSHSGSPDESATKNSPTRSTAKNKSRGR